MDWLEWLALVEFIVNNKVYLAIKVSLFMANYGRELRMRVDIKKGKIKKMMEFTERIKKVQEETGVILRKLQKEMKQQVNKKRKKAEVWKKGNKVMPSTKDLVFKEQPARKLVDQYVGLYIIKEVVSTNIVKL